MRPLLVAATLAALGVVGCSGEAPPPPPPPQPPETTTPAPEPVAPEVAATPEVAPAPPEIVATAPPPPRVPRTLGVTYAGGCAIHEQRVSCWGQSPRADEDEDPTERPEVQLSGDFVDLVVSDYLAGARRGGAGGVEWFGDGADIASDARTLEEEDAEDEDDWVGDDEEISDLDRAADALAGAIDLALGPAGACVVRRPAADRTTVSCGGEAFEASALEGVRGADGVVEACVGDGFACGRTAAGQVLCWGDNEAGQLGDGLESDHADSASEVRGLEHVLHIACGDAHACALRDDGSVWCWGENAFGQLARGMDVELSREPVRIADLSGMRAIAVGGASSCALRDEGPPLCWGGNHAGQLGDGTTRSADAPVEASAIGPVRELALGVDHACAVRGDETSSEVVCWGLGAEGAIGPRARRRDFAPVELFAGVSGISRVAVGSQSVCVIVGEPDTGEVRCVGRAGADPGEGLEAARVIHAVPRDELRTYPTLAALLTPSGPGIRTRRIARWACSLAGQRVECTPTGVPGAAPVTVEDVVSIASSTTEVCVAHTAGGVECASEASGSPILRFAPVPHFPPAAAVAHMSSARCVVTREEGALVCEGRRDAWHAGTEIYPPASEEDAGPRPTGVPLMHRYRDVRAVVQVAQGGVVRLEDGRIVRLSPTAPPTQLLDHAEPIVEGSNFACARRVGDSGADAWCWGLNTQGQLARADTTASAVLVPGLTIPLPPTAEGAPPVDLSRHGVLEIVAAESNACARLSDGRLVCWGADTAGQLGRAPAVLRLRPVVVLD